jgi:hypothetical protein
MREGVQIIREGCVSLMIARRCRAYHQRMSDFIFIAATIVFFAICDSDESMTEVTTSSFRLMG